MESTKTNLGSVITDDEWRAHVLNCLKFEGTDSDYCRAHGLNRKTFHRYRKALGLARPYHQRRRSNFARVLSEAPPKVSVPKDLNVRGTSVDPEWVARLVKALFMDRLPLR